MKTTRRDLLLGGAALLGGYALGKPTKGILGGKGRIDGAQGQPTAKSYIQNGLLALWDGIENVGWGEHDSTTTIWKDLSGNGFDLTLRNTASFDEVSLVSAERNLVTALLSGQLPYASIEICAFFDAARNSSALVCFGNSVDNAIMMACNTSTVQCYNGSNVVNLAKEIPAKSTWSATHSGAEHTAYVNGRHAVGSKTTNNWTSRAGTFGLSGSSNYHVYNFVGNYYCVRLYSRALTPEEVAANYAVDKARFSLP